MKKNEVNIMKVENIKCPHCHSSAQVIQDSLAVVSDNGAYFNETYHCGCGCHFTVSYERIVDEYIIETIEKR